MADNHHTALLEADRVRVTYGGVVAVDDVSLSVPEGSVFGLIGPNGAGKTSLIDALTGYYPPSGGRVLFEGDDITGMKPYNRARRGLARTFQSLELFDDLSVEENVLVAADHIGVLRALGDLLVARTPSRSAADWAIEVCGLQDVAHLKPTELPHGRRKLVGVARALARRPKLVLMDEPAAGLDTDESSELGRRLRELPGAGVTVLLVDHDMGLVLGVCDEVQVIDFGKTIARGTPQEIRQNPAVIAAYLGTEEVEHVAS
jgi:branched-chain amino acid transport system ATP-binding protein